MESKRKYNKKPRIVTMCGLCDGGQYWTRTNDPCDVNTVLYQLS